MKQVKIRFIATDPRSWSRDVPVGTEVYAEKYTMAEDGALLNRVWVESYDRGEPFPNGFPEVIYSYTGPGITPEKLTINKGRKPYQYAKDDGWLRAEFVEEITVPIAQAIRSTKPAKPVPPTPIVDQQTLF